MKNDCCNRYPGNPKPFERLSILDPDPRIRRIAVAIWEHLERRGCALPAFEPGVRTLARLTIDAEDELANIERLTAGPDTPENRKALRTFKALYRRSLSLLKMYRRNFLDPPIPTDSPADSGELGSVQTAQKGV